MQKQLTVVGIGGSMREGSTSLAALMIALEGAAESGATAELFDVRLLELPMYNPDEEETPEAARRLADACHGAQGLLWASPMYHGTVSGSFKNALDWLQLLADRDPPFLTDKVIGLISVAGGTQGVQAVNTMEFAVRALRGWAVPLVVPVPESWKAFDDRNRPHEPRIESSLHALGREVTRVAERLAREEVTDPAAECAAAAARASRAGKP